MLSKSEELTKRGAFLSSEVEKIQKKWISVYSFPLTTFILLQ